MNFESIKNFIQTHLENFYDKVTDSHIYNICLEKYESLDIRHQKWIQYSFLSLIALLLLSIPLTIGLRSFDTIQDFKTKKDLIFQLLNKDNQTTFTDISPIELETRISTVLSKFNLSKEARIQTIAPAVQVPAHLKTLKYSTTSVQIEEVNANEMVSIGTQLDQISPTVKVLQFTIIESESDNYFNVVFSLVHFQQPQTKKITPTRKS